MKICFLAGLHYIHTYRWVRYFSQNHDVHLISLKYPESEFKIVGPADYEKIGVKLHEVERVGAGKLLAPLRIRKLMRKINPDVAHAHYITHYGFLGAFSGFHPFVMTAWGTDVLLESKESFWKGFQVKYALRRADMLTCDGENTSERLVELGVPKESISRIYFGIDTKKANPDKRDKNIFQKYMKDEETKIVINIRGFNPVYDPDAFVDAVPAIIKDFPNTVFLMAREDPRRNKTEEKVRLMGLENHVRFIGDIPADLIPSYLASSDIYVSVSLSDSGISASTAEAMSCGAPVISTDVGDAKIWIENGKSGFLIPRGDSKALAEKIRYLLADENARLAIGREARRTIVERQDYHKEMAKMEKIYEELSRRS